MWAIGAEWPTVSHRLKYHKDTNNETTNQGQAHISNKECTNGADGALQERLLAQAAAVTCGSLGLNEPTVSHRLKYHKDINVCVVVR